jgi:hypothetical protein
MRIVRPWVFGVVAVTVGLAAAACGTTSATPSGDPGSGVPTATPTSTGTPGPSGLPCDVEKTLADNCGKCHGATPAFGAPMPLVTHTDLVAPAKSDPSKKVYELVTRRIHDDGQPMPPPPNARLSSVDLGVLDSWAAAGAPSSKVACNPQTPGDGGVVEPLDCKPDLAIAPASPWAMPVDAKNEYVCYGVDIDSPDDKHIVAMTPRVQNPKIVHHVLVFKSDSAYPTTPQVCPSGGSLQWRLMYAWAPGGKNMVMPPEAGYALKKGQTTHFIVQVHYNNAGALTNQTDTSGFDMCTSAPRKYEADVLAFGTQKIDLKKKSELDTTCSITVPASLAGKKIFAAMPHMHELGTTIETKLYRGGTGAPVDLGAAPKWDFQTQYWYPLDVSVATNDVVKTRCAWKNTTNTDVKFGENTEDEMCYSFTMYYPRIDSNLWTWALPALGSQCSPTTP